MFCWDLKGGSFACNVLEQDAYGRILYTYTTENVVTQNVETATVICQAIDEKYVYYYENVCFAFGELTAEQIEILKQNNAWNCELDYSRMASKSRKTSLDLVIIVKSSIERSKLLAVCCDELNVEEVQIKELCFLGSNSGNMELYWLSLEQENNGVRFFLITNEDYNVAFLQSDGSLDSIATIALFKLQNGW